MKQKSFKWKRKQKNFNKISVNYIRQKKHNFVKHSICVLENITLTIVDPSYKFDLTMLNKKALQYNSTSCRSRTSTGAEQICFS